MLRNVLIFDMLNLSQMSSYFKKEHNTNSKLFKWRQKN